MVIVHHLNNSRSQRILWALEELDVPYEVKRYERDAVTNLAPDSLKKIHPLGKSPVITDDGKTIAESGAIIEYLCQTYGNNEFAPEVGSEAYQQYAYWLHFAEGSLMPQLLLKIVFDKVVTSPMPFFVKPIAKGISKKVMSGYVSPNIKSMLTYIESYLDGKQWFAGEQVSGADMQMVFPLEACVMNNVAGSQYVNIREYVKRVHARPAYKKALETGGPYDYA